MLPKRHLHLNNFSASINDHELFNAIAVSLFSGSLLHIHGANGSGKSTLLAMIAGLKPLQGQLYWQDNGQNKALVENDIFYLGHKPAIKMALTVSENIRYLHSLHEGKIENSATLLDSLGLRQQGHTLAQHLSQGQQQRLALAPLLWVKQPLWLLDEPLVALDKTAKEWLSGLFNRHLQQQGFIILASHEALSGINHPIQHLFLGAVNA